VRTVGQAEAAEQPWQRFLPPKSTDSEPAVKASINTAEYILEPPP
jgi:hypothetical protein